MIEIESTAINAQELFGKRETGRNRMGGKYGSYIEKLMTVVLDGDQDEFVKQLAWNELNRLGDGVKEFLANHLEDDLKEKKKTEKILLQEEQNGKKKENENNRVLSE